MSATVDARSQQAAFAAFSFLWAVANIAHLWIQTGGSLDQPAAVVNMAAAAWVLADPRSVGRLVLLAATQLFDTVWVMPFAPDHQMLVASVNVVILLVALTMLFGRDRQPDSARFYASFSGAARILLLVGYSAAAIAKYNSAFFDPVISCAVFLANTATYGLTEAVSGLDWFHIAVATTAETLIPIMLVIPATRRFGVRFGMLFHFLVSLSPAITVSDFTTTLFALFLLFLAPSEIAAIFSDMHRRFRESPVGRPLLGFGRVPLVIMFALAASFSGYLVPSIDIIYLWAFATLFGVILLRAAAWTFSMRVAPQPIAVRVPVPHLAVVVLLAMWSLNPYLGYRTTSSFTMFSNLITEGQGTNHFFLPSVHYVDYQNDLLEPTSSTNERLDELANDGQLVTVFEAQRLLDRDPGATVVARRNGGPEITFSLDDLGDAPSPLLTKLWFFRWIPGSGEPQCTN